MPTGTIKQELKADNHIYLRKENPVGIINRIKGIEPLKVNPSFSGHNMKKWRFKQRQEEYTKHYLLVAEGLSEPLS
jgi:hypothetical protein